jgi:hypothetical protein
MANKLVLPSYLTIIHDVFHVFLLQKAEIDPSWVLPKVPLEVEEDLTLKVKLVQVLYQSEKNLGIRRYL